MKTILVIFITGTLLSTSAFSAGVITNNEKVLHAFNEAFKDVQDLKWYINDKEYTAYFSQNSIRIKITYDADGRVQSSRRGIPADYLPLNVIAAVRKKCGGKEIREVVEIVEENQLSYSIKIEDELNFWVMEAFTNGDIRQFLKFKK